MIAADGSSTTAALINTSVSQLPRESDGFGRSGPHLCESRAKVGHPPILPIARAMTFLSGKCRSWSSWSPLAVQKILVDKHSASRGNFFPSHKEYCIHYANSAADL